MEFSIYDYLFLVYNIDKSAHFGAKRVNEKVRESYHGREKT